MNVKYVLILIRLIFKDRILWFVKFQTNLSVTNRHFFYPLLLKIRHLDELLFIEFSLHDYLQ